jgi:hypothetical protein
MRKRKMETDILATQKQEDETWWEDRTPKVVAPTQDRIEENILVMMQEDLRHQPREAVSVSLFLSLSLSLSLSLFLPPSLPLSLHIPLLLLLAVQGIELRVLCLLGRLYHMSHSHSFFGWDKVSLYAQGSLHFSPPIYTSHADGITIRYH